MFKEKSTNSIDRDSNNPDIRNNFIEREEQLCEEMVRLAKELRNAHKARYTGYRDKKTPDLHDSRGLNPNYFKGEKDLRNSSPLIKNLRVSNDSKYNMVNNTMTMSRDNIQYNYTGGVSNFNSIGSLRPLTERYTDYEDEEQVQAEKAIEYRDGVQDNMDMNDNSYDYGHFDGLTKKCQEHVYCINNFLASEAEKIDQLYSELDQYKVKINL